MPFQAKKNIDFNDESEWWEIVGEQSGHVYAQFGSKDQAENYLL